MFKKNFLEILRWSLRLHGIGHLVEVFAAVCEGAYITASIALFHGQQFACDNFPILVSYFV